MAYSLSSQSRAKFANVHPDLVKVVERAIGLSQVDFRVTEGARTLARQKQLLAAGASKTLKSRHIPTTNRSKMAEAIDIVCLVNGKVRWDWPLYPIAAKAMKQAAKDLGIPITWGGDWPRFRDGPHFELTRGSKYG